MIQKTKGETFRKEGEAGGGRGTSNLKGKETGKGRKKSLGCRGVTGTGW